MAATRRALPLLGGLIIGCFLMTFKQSFNFEQLSSVGIESCPAKKEKEFVDLSEHWQVHLDEMLPAPPKQDAAPKVVRVRFAATELGIRERLMVAVLAESSLALALNSSIGRHVPRIQLFADAGRIDAELVQMNNLSPYPTGDSRNGQKSHAYSQRPNCLQLKDFRTVTPCKQSGRRLYILALMQNLTQHESYDWFFLVKDSTYVNPFALKSYMDRVNWNQPVLIGEPDSEGRCRLESGVLISFPAMQLLLKNRQQCLLTASDSSDSDQLAFEKCLHVATNLTCINFYQGVPYTFWRVDGPHAAHDSVGKWAELPGFNQSIVISKILSDADSSALHDHFIKVEMARLDLEIAEMESEIAGLMPDTDEGPTWPAAVPQYSKPPNRYQVSTWEFFTIKDIFRNEPNQNVRPLEGKDYDDVVEVVLAARQYVEQEQSDLEFVQMRNGYRMFDPRRGMDYMIDLVYKIPGSSESRSVERRVHLSRMIASTQLLNQVPYVKEDTDLTIVVPLNNEDEVLPARKLLARHAKLCTNSVEETRKTRFVVTTTDTIDPRSATNVANDLEELKRRCKQSSLETDLIKVKSRAAADFQTPSGWSPVTAALDEAVDRYGPNMIYLALSPHADLQREFLDRVRINTIKKYQVFFPLPFYEFHPTISEMDIEETEVAKKPGDAREEALNRLRDIHPPTRKRPLIVQKDHGRFDSLDFSCMSVYGSDYMALRSKLTGKHLDLVSIFMGQEEIHVLRAVEPSLRLRYHQRSCDHELAEDDHDRCVASKKENVAAKDQLARMLYHEK